MSNKNQQGTHKVYRNSKNGRFVEEKYAKKHPSTTEKQTVKNNRKGK